VIVINQLGKIAELNEEGKHLRITFFNTEEKVIMVYIAKEGGKQIEEVRYYDNGQIATLVLYLVRDNFYLKHG
jgi:antitoxin component YwqK of YwqJK toxin-antitoxin module